MSTFPSSVPLTFLTCNYVNGDALRLGVGGGAGVAAGVTRLHQLYQETGGGDGASLDRHHHSITAPVITHQLFERGEINC